MEKQKHGVEIVEEEIGVPQVVDMLMAIDERYARVFVHGLKAQRLLLPGDQEFNRALALGNIVEESPTLAVAAFEGSADSDDVGHRRDAAYALVSLSFRFPADALRIAERLCADQDSDVRELATAATRWMSLAEQTRAARVGRCATEIMGDDLPAS